MLFEPVKVGPYTLPNRIVMAPMTRSRAKEGFVPSDMAPKYYAQRASAGLIVTEATQVSPQGIGYVHTPGIYTKAQVDGWKKVTEAVHQAGGRIFLQLWHVGRISNRTLQPDNQLPVAPSAVAPKGESMTIDYQTVPYEAPRALETHEIAGIVEDFRQGAENAKAAGFDGVELHGANGYLIDQFLRDGTNRRTDQYGGSAENRVRFLIEVTEAVVGVWGGERVGVRLSPNAAFNDMHDSNPRETFGTAVKALERFNLAYLHVTRVAPGDDVPGGPIDADFFRPLFRNPIITAAGFTGKAQAEEALKSGKADLVAFATLFISNPDLPARFKQNAPLAKADRTTFYGGDAKGYIDYPSLEAAVA
jgi:N-ethylmaleimide reductase